MAASSGDGDTGQADDQRHGSVGSRFLRLSRDLVAKRAVERHLRRQIERSFVPDFEMLPCCSEKFELQHRLEMAEVQMRRQYQEESNVVSARKEEVAQLGAEVAQLRRRAQRRGLDAGLAGISSLGVSAGAWSVQAELERVEQEAHQARKAAAEDAATLEVERAKAAKELSRLQERLLAVAPPPAPSRPPPPAISAAGAVNMLPGPGERDGASAAEDDSPESVVTGGFGALRAAPQGANQGLAQRCVELHGVMDQLLAILGQLPLPPCPPDEGPVLFDAHGHGPWLTAMASTMTDLHGQLRSPA